MKSLILAPMLLLLASVGHATEIRYLKLGEMVEKPSVYCYGNGGSRTTQFQYNVDNLLGNKTVVLGLNTSVLIGTTLYVCSEHEDQENDDQDLLK